MGKVIVFHLKRFYPFDPEKSPGQDDKCARCGHEFLFHVWHDVASTCGFEGCRCPGFMVNLYDDIKTRRKTSEFRNMIHYWIKRLCPNAVWDPFAGKPQDLTKYLEVSEAWFVTGYPKGSLPRVETDIRALWCDSYCSQLEIKFDVKVEVL